jgi:hypothetical protein
MTHTGADRIARQEIYQEAQNAERGREVLNGRREEKEKARLSK